MIFASVCASNVLPHPVGPTSSTFDFCNSTSPVLGMGDALVVVEHRDRQHLLGVRLADHVLIEDAAMTCGLGIVPGLPRLVVVDRLSSSRTSWHRSMHWSQMYTPGPATSLRTCS